MTGWKLFAVDQSIICILDYTLASKKRETTYLVAQISNGLLTIHRFEINIIEADSS